MGEPEVTGGVLLDVDRLIHGPARLGIVVVLSEVEEVDFNYLRMETGLTWGNLSANLMVLEEAGYVEIRKVFKGKRPQTWARLSGEGRAAYARYRRHMRDLLSI